MCRLLSASRLLPHHCVAQARTAAVIAMLMVALTASGNAAGAVKIRLPYSIYHAPATVHVNVMVVPDASNRVLRIEAEGELLFRASEVQLDGANAARIHSFEFRDLPEGHYQLRAEVRSATNVVRGVDFLPVIVIGRGLD